MHIYLICYIKVLLYVRPHGGDMTRHFETYFFLSFCLFVVMLFQLNGYSYFSHSHHNRKFIQYTLVDLGPTDMDARELSHFSIPISYSPKINNDSLVLFNTRWGGQVWNDMCGSAKLTYGEKNVFFHDFGSKGTILGSYYDDDCKIQWVLWPECCGKRIDPTIIPFNNPEGSTVYLRRINSKGVIAGTIVFGFGDHQDAFAVVWTPNNTLQTVYPGMGWDVSEEGYIIGNSKWDPENRPYLWHYTGGPIVLSDNRCLKKPEGCVHYVDTLFGYDGSVYGSFYYDEKPGYLYTYHWDPMQERFGFKNLNGMRVSDVNNMGTLVGSLCNAAVVCKKDSTPVDLNHLIDVQGKKWNLQEATSINDKGQIVGYGTVDGKTHIFLLEPVTPVLKIYQK